MENTLQVNDRVGVNKIGNFFSEIKRGEVVVFRDSAGWLPDPDPAEAGIVGKAKSALVFVGILPNPAKQYLIKRVIGVGGDRIVCCDATHHLKVNNISVKEPYIFKGDRPSDTDFKVTVPKGFIWVMGDHRSASTDSRYQPDSANNGLVPLSKVVGRATFIIWPFGNIALLEKGEDLKKIPVKAKS